MQEGVPRGGIRSQDRPRTVSPLGQVEALSARMGDFAREAQRTPVAEVEAQNLRAELERLKGRGWLARLLNL